MLSEEIVVRNPGLNWREPPARRWFGGSAFLSNCMNAFSTTFPAGERFFIESVRAYRDRLADPVLLEQLSRFIGQEGAHAREHNRFNARLRAHGYPVEQMEARVERVLGFLKRRYGPPTWLAATCAVEHFTTILCTVLLRSPEFYGAMAGDDARLWCWHWVEELEHKSVAFDVYAAGGGSYSHRVVVMIGATLVMWPLLLSIVLRYQAHDGRLLSLSDWWTGFGWALLRPGLLRRVLPAYFAYFRRGYHPSQNPDRDLVGLWRERLII